MGSTHRVSWAVVFYNPFLQGGGVRFKFSVVGDGERGESGCLFAFLLGVLFLGEEYFSHLSFSFWAKVRLGSLRRLWLVAKVAEVCRCLMALSSLER